MNRSENNSVGHQHDKHHRCCNEIVAYHHYQIIYKLSNNTKTTDKETFIAYTFEFKRLTFPKKILHFAHFCEIG